MLINSFKKCELFWLLILPVFTKLWLDSIYVFRHSWAPREGDTGCVCLQPSLNFKQPTYKELVYIKHHWSMKCSSCSLRKKWAEEASIVLHHDLNSQKIKIRKLFLRVDQGDTPTWLSPTPLHKHVHSALQFPNPTLCATLSELSPIRYSFVRITLCAHWLLLQEENVPASTATASFWPCACWDHRAGGATQPPYWFQGQSTCPRVLWRRARNFEFGNARAGWAGRPGTGATLGKHTGMWALGWAAGTGRRTHIYCQTLEYNQHRNWTLPALDFEGCLTNPSTSSDLGWGHPI